MSFSESAVFKHLQSLVSFDTQNPPRNIFSSSAIFVYLKENLPGFSFEIISAGDGCLSLLAIRGKPDLLFNFHIDTVPIAEGWNTDPHELQQVDDTLVGLGACDIKGAAACMLSAVSKSQSDVALLFSSDEEHGSSQAIKKFLTTDHGFKKVVVAEPTKAKAVIAHRGIQTATASFYGESGHASEARALKDNAIHKAGNWIALATRWFEEQSDVVDELSGIPFNVGSIAGGIKANMIAAKCEMKFGFRPLPGQDSSKILLALQKLEGEQQISSAMSLKSGFFGPCLPAANQEFDKAIVDAKALSEQLDLESGSAVNFWTEASLFSQSGLTALVFGPGNIAQAHTANEWVAISQLQRVEQAYINILEKNILEKQT